MQRLLLPLALILAGACHPAAGLVVQSATDLGPQAQGASIKGRDGGYSVLFDGVSVWDYGDSILSVAGVDGSSWRNNTMSWTSDLTVADGISGYQQSVDANGAPYEFIPQTAEEQAYNTAHADVDTNGDGVSDCTDPCGAREAIWPSAMVVDPASGTALIFYAKIHGEPGAWNFYGLGRGIATWDSLTAEPIRTDVSPAPDPADPTLLWLGEGVTPGDAALLVGANVYAYSCNADSADKTCRLARAPFANALDLSAWAWWDGSTWSPDITQATGIFVGAPQLSIHYAATLGVYLAVYMDSVSGEMVARTAPAPEGPWSDPVTLLTGVAPYSGFLYAGMAHPEYEVGGTEFLSYYRSTGDWTGEIRLATVTLSR